MTHFRAVGRSWLPVLLASAIAPVTARAEVVAACVTGVPSNARPGAAENLFYDRLVETNDRLKRVATLFVALVHEERARALGGDEDADRRGRRYLEVAGSPGRVSSDDEAGIRDHGNLIGYLDSYREHDDLLHSVHWAEEGLPSARGWDPGFAIISARKRVLRLLERPLRSTLAESRAAGGGVAERATRLRAAIRAFASSSNVLREYYDCVYDRQVAAAAARAARSGDGPRVDPAVRASTRDEIPARELDVDTAPTASDPTAISANEP